MVSLCHILVFSDAGYPAYVYELQHRLSEHNSHRPDFAKADHGDEIAFVFGKPFFIGESGAFQEFSTGPTSMWWAHSC